MARQKYLLDTCICVYWLRDKFNVKDRIDSVGFDKYAEEKARLTIAGTPTGDFDLLIGCTAVAKKMVMVTQNIKDFENIGHIKLENWISIDK